LLRLKLLPKGLRACGQTRVVLRLVVFTAHGGLLRLGTGPLQGLAACIERLWPAAVVRIIIAAVVAIGYLAVTLLRLRLLHLLPLAK